MKGKEGFSLWIDTFIFSPFGFLSTETPGANGGLWGLWIHTQLLLSLATPEVVCYLICSNLWKSMERNLSDVIKVSLYMTFWKHIQKNNLISKAAWNRVVFLFCFFFISLHRPHEEAKAEVPASQEGDRQDSTLVAPIQISQLQVLLNEREWSFLPNDSCMTELNGDVNLGNISKYIKI